MIEMRKSTTKSLFPLLFAVVLLALLVYRYGEQWLHSLLLYLSKAGWARQIVSHWHVAWLVASRFIAGTDINAALTVTRQLNNKGMLVTLDYLGESVTTADEASQACEQILKLLDCIETNHVQANVSVKLSQLGMKISGQIAHNNVRRLLERAQKYGNKIRIDMEDSSTVDATLALYRHLRDAEGFNNVGIVIQAYLYRSVADVEQLVKEGAWVRLCKGAYAEPSDVAFPVKANTDQNYMQLTQLLLSAEARQNGVYAGIATHDPAMIEATIAYAKTHQVPQDAFEFQMLHGVRRDLQEKLTADGYTMRVYVPYGTAWYPYFMRRLAERPANLWFFISNFFRA